MENKETTKQALVEIMDADQKDGVYYGLPRLSICTGCGHFSNKPLGLNKQGEPYLACCPDNNYVPVTQSPTAVEWLEKELEGFCVYKNLTYTQGQELIKTLEKAKELESYQKNNLPIHIHEGISNTHVYIENGIVHIKPNKQTQTTENGKSNN
jgi:hypothetical protein